MSSFYDPKRPWNLDVNGQQVLPLINDDCPVLRVQAGPGTGKTFGLRRRVLRVLHPDGLAVSAERVLVCAFNRVIAADLKKEISTELGKHGLELPKIQTIHSLCSDLASVSPRILLPQEVEAMVFDVRCQYSTIKTQVGANQRAVMRALREHESGLKDHPALGQATRQWLADHKAEQIGDLPRHVERRLANGEFADTRFDHVIVDEFQDLTDTEARIVARLVSEGGSLVVLGDRKQSIYAFRGNDKRGLAMIAQLVATAITDHTMNECQRCPPEVVQLSNAVMALENEPLTALAGNVGQIYQVHHNNPAAECKQMAKEILRVYEAEKDKKHLVLVTRRKWGYELRNAIRALDPSAPVQTVFAEDILETWPAREAFLLLSVVGDPEDHVTLRDWVSYQKPNAEGKKFKASGRNAEAYLNLKNEVGPLTVEKIRGLSGRTAKEFKGAGRGHLAARLARLIELLDNLPSTEDTSELLEHILDPDRWVQSSYLEAELAREDLGRLLAESRRLLKEREGVTLKTIVKALRYQIATRHPIGEPEQEGIKIVTLWGAKGLTADYVYLVGLIDEALPGPGDSESTGLSDGEHLEEQRRLLYVSLTRGKKALVLSRPLQVRTGDIPALGLLWRSGGNKWWKPVRTCRFLEDLPAGTLPASMPFEKWGGLQIGN